MKRASTPLMLSVYSPEEILRNVVKRKTVLNGTREQAGVQSEVQLAVLVHRTPHFIPREKGKDCDG